MRTIPRLAAIGVFVVLTACDAGQPVASDQGPDQSLRQATTAETSATQPTSASMPSSVAVPVAADAMTATPSPPTVGATATPPQLSTSAPPEVPDPRMYRPDPIRVDDHVTATLRPATLASPDPGTSTVAFSLVEFPDGRFLQVDLSAVTVPTGAELWTVEVNGRLKMKTSATAGSTLGARLDRDVYGNTVIVSLNATTADGQIISTTGDIEITDGG